MTVTEDEALNKWCPNVIASHTDPRRGFHPGADPEKYRYGLHVCIGAACMAWRWGEPQRVLMKGAIAQDARYAVTEDEAKKNGGEYTPVPGRRGFCGLAGQL